MSVSVVIPCFNRVQILGRAIESALNQTCPPAEVVVVDDGSNDGSPDVARRFGDRLRVIQQSNSGAASARNRGIEAARGDWVAFLDSDDQWHPHKLELQLAAAQRFPAASLVFCDTLVRDEHQVVMPSRFALGGLYGNEVESDGDFARYDRSLFEHMLTQSRVITSAVMVRRGLPELKFPEHIWGSEDWALWLTLALRYPFASVNQMLVTMHQQGDNISARKGRLYRNDVIVLEDLLQDPALSSAERDEVGSTLQARRVGALYHSLVRGEVRESRALLRDIPAGDLRWSRVVLYRMATCLPGAWIRRMAALRS